MPTTPSSADGPGSGGGTTLGATIAAFATAADIKDDPCFSYVREILSRKVPTCEIWPALLAEFGKLRNIFFRQALLHNLIETETPAVPAPTSIPKTERKEYSTPTEIQRYIDRHLTKAVNKQLAYMAKAKAYSPTRAEAQPRGNCPNCKDPGHHVKACTTACSLSSCKGRDRHLPCSTGYPCEPGRARKANKPEYERLRSASNVSLRSASASDNSVVLKSCLSTQSSSHLNALSSSSSSHRTFPDLRSVIFDIGATDLVSPHRISSDTPVSPYNDTLSTATGATTPITGTQIFGPATVFIAPALSDGLVPQKFVSDCSCSTFLSSNQLHILDSETTTRINDIIMQSSPIVKTTRASDGLYHFTRNELEAIKLQYNRPLSVALARYHTVQFPTKRDLVLYWHHVFRHASKELMVRIVKFKVFKNLPAQLTVTAIHKHFPVACLDCALGSIQLISPPGRSAPPTNLTRPAPIGPNQPIVPIPPLPKQRKTVTWGTQQTLPHDMQCLDDLLRNIAESEKTFAILRGAHWQGDFKKFSGNDDEPIKSYKGHTHSFASIDKATSRVYGMPTKGCANAHESFQRLWNFNKRNGCTMETFSVDKAFHTSEMLQACAACVPPVRLAVAVPDEHFGIGGIERWHRSIHESIQKKSLNHPHITSNMWHFGFDDDLDMYNALPTARHPTKSPYQLYDGITMDVDLSPLFIYGQIVVAQIPTKHQTTHGGRGIELVVVGRNVHGFEGVRLYNPKTKRDIIRRSVKVLGDHPIKQFQFTSEITLEIPLSDPELDVLTAETADAAIAAQALDDVPPVLVEYSMPLQIKGVSHSQQHFFNSIGKRFVETVAGKVQHLWRIQAIVRKDRTLFYQYFDDSQPRPTFASEFEYTPCRELLTASWADFQQGNIIANLIKSGEAILAPRTYAAMLVHPERRGYEEALHEECRSYHSSGAVGSQPADFDWSSVDPKSIGDMMILFSKKMKPDGTFDKYKCRIVFRGDRWNNVNHLSTHSSSMDTDALKLLLATAATEDLDIFSTDVKTAFLHGRFPAGVTQYVRSPPGLPPGLLPRKFLLDRCSYGHPLANAQWDEHSTGTLLDIGFVPLVSCPSVYRIDMFGTWLLLGKITDDFVMVCEYNSPLKAYVISEIAKRYTITTRDPLTNFVGLHLERNRASRTLTLTQPGHISEMTRKYPLPIGDVAPLTPMLPNTSTPTSEDERLTRQYLSPVRLRELQSLIGDISWLVHQTRPDALYALNMVARHGPNPTELDWKRSMRIAQYLIATAHIGLTIGGTHGVQLVCSVDSSYATHADMKSHSMWSLHLGGSGTVLARTKKQSIMSDSSTLSELIGAHLALRDIMWARKFLREIGFRQKHPTTLFIDNKSTLKIIANPTDSGKTRHIDIRYNMIREQVKQGHIRCEYLCTEHMIADIGTKALSTGPFLYLRNFLLGSQTLAEFALTYSRYRP